MGEGHKEPCASCPFRCDVPSGIWGEVEYDKLELYDAPLTQQPRNLFACHQSDGALCAGWLAHTGNPNDLLAVRIAVLDFRVSPTVLRYSTRVPLFRSGKEAAEHGRRDIDNPSPEARAAVAKIARVREIRGVPIEFG